jgi:quinohemoprotein ethanol dehydrogenase
VWFDHAGAASAQPGMIDELRLSHQRPGDWLLNGRDTGNTHFSPLDQINRTNVARLGLAWEFRDFLVRGGIHRGMESNPVFVDGVLYFSGPWGNAYAVGARAGKALWTYDANADGQYARRACCDVVNRGVAVWKSKVYVASLDGWLACLDARDGKPVWRVDTIADRHFNTTVNGAPAIAGDNVLIGNAGADMGSRGYVSAYDLKTGKLRWRFWAVPGDPRKGPDETPEVSLARKSWAKNTRWDLGGGGNPWDSIVYDPSLGLVYIGLGNGGPLPRWLRSPGGGDNLFVSTIVAVVAKTGRMKWFYQETPGDSWDYTATAPMVRADLRWQGRMRRVLMQAPKNGIFYVLARETGKVLSADPYTAVNWTGGVDLETGRPRVTPQADYSRTPAVIWPGSAGGHGWQPMAWDPRTGLVYLPVYDAPTEYRTLPVPKFLSGSFNNGAAGNNPPPDPVHKIEGRLKAWNPLVGKPVWVSPPLPFSNGGTLATAGGLVFQGAADGNLSVYGAGDGKLLRRIFTGTSIMAAPIAYQLDGTEYVAVLAGAGGPRNVSWESGSAPLRYENFERLLVFRLNGGTIPLPSKFVPPPREQVPPKIAADAMTLQHGQALFEQQCARCHQEGGGLGAYPDLWNTPRSMFDGFDAIVYGGALRYAGMGAFSDIFSRADVAAIKAFIVDDEIARRSGRQSQAAPRIRYH